MNLTQLKQLFAQAGVKNLYAKPLAENDNSKNQVYFGPNFQALNLLPISGITAEEGAKTAHLKARLNFWWLQPNGSLENAAGAQLILYPQYPEVRFSGFLKGCQNAPSELMANRLMGRILFLGVTNDRRVLGFVAAPFTEIAQAFRADISQPTIGIFSELNLPNAPNESDSRNLLLDQLIRIHRLGWIDSKQLGSNGLIKPCNAPQCGGFTLEAELGVAKNSVSEPDYLGWEVKQHNVTNFDSVEVGAITLMTPEPTGGFYKEKGVQAFVRKYGYADRRGRENRMNFGGIHRIGHRHPLTNLTMLLQGYNTTTRRITDPKGCIALVDDVGEVAAAWAFTGLLTHWSRKHTRAAFVPSQCRKEPVRQYHYGHTVRLAEGTDPLLLLKGLSTGTVYYDPGIKLENIHGLAKSKSRSQFRIASKSINSLYSSTVTVELKL